MSQDSYMYMYHMDAISTQANIKIWVLTGDKQGTLQPVVDSHVPTLLFRLIPWPGHKASLQTLTLLMSKRSGPPMFLFLLPLLSFPPFQKRPSTLVIQASC